MTLKKLESKDICDGQIVLAVITAPGFPSLKASRKTGYFVGTFSHLEGEERDKTHSTTGRTKFTNNFKFTVLSAGLWAEKIRMTDPGY